MSQQGRQAQKLAPTSRLIVKNLPVHLTEVRFREHFKKIGGNISDVKIIKREYVITYIFYYLY